MRLGTRTPKRSFLGVITGLVLTLVVAQFIRPELLRSPVSADLQVTPEVKQILSNSCYPCHSNQPRLRWFDEIVPAYQLVVHDVASARMHLNFSGLGTVSVERRNAVLFESLNQIQLGAMPPARYRALHPESVVTPRQISILINYLLSAAPSAATAQSNVVPADTQYRQWIASANTPTKVHDAPNGIAFIPEYKNWQVISTTVREDTKTLRLISGNAIAIKAIAENKINPWPDGAILAKVAWRQTAGENGRVETGEFFRMALMIKDKAKYSSTAGWGWAQWGGTELTPYGTDPGFARECVGCHAPLRKNDYVFTMPIQSLGKQSSFRVPHE